MVVTTISCDAVILRCSSCQTEVAVASATPVGNCCTCGETVVLDRSCDGGFALQRSGLLIRRIAENKEGWRCDDESGRDFCRVHIHLADPPPAELSGRRASYITL